MKPDAKKQIVTLLGAIEKKKILAKKMRKEKAKRVQWAQEWSIYADHKEKEKKLETMEEEKKLKTLKEELRAVNLENAKNIDRVTLEYQCLYNTREEIVDIMKNNEEKRIDLIDELETIFSENKETEITVGQLSYCWYEDPESGDPFEAVYGILYDDYSPPEEDDEFCPDNQDCSIFARINGRGELIEENIRDDDWIDFIKTNEKIGHITFHAK